MALRDAQRLAAVLRELAVEGRPCGSGWMAWDGVGSWADYAAGLGDPAEPFVDADLDDLLDFYALFGQRAVIQVTPYDHAGLLGGLAGRGFVPQELVNVLVHGGDDLRAAPATDLTFRPVDPADAASLSAFVDAQLIGFHGAVDAAPPGLVPITRRVPAVDRVRCWVVEDDGAPVGSCGLEFWEDSAVLIAGSVFPSARRRGVHQAMLRFRLAWAFEAGARYCLIGSAAGGPTERNALRLGFRPAYTVLDLRGPAPPSPHPAPA